MSNMYEFAKTWNPLAGDCIHNCSYCYGKTWKKRFEHHRKKYSGEPRLDEIAMKKNLGIGNFWFVQSMSDLFAKNVPSEMILSILKHCRKYWHNQFFFQSKNPEKFNEFINLFPENTILCTTIETNRPYLIKRYSGGQIAEDRAYALSGITVFVKRHITIEPIMDFDLSSFVGMLEYANPSQINIGADSSNKKILPEPPKEKILELISELEKFTNVHLKPNLNRLIE